MYNSQSFTGIDSGPQGTKTVVFSREGGRIFAKAYTDHRMLKGAGGREQQPAWWIDACATVLDRSPAHSSVARERICAIGVSGQQHGILDSYLS